MKVHNAGADVRRAPRSRRKAMVSVGLAVLTAVLGLHVVAAPDASAAPVGQGFNLNRSDLRFILRQAQISERHVATRTPEEPCSTLLGAGADQIPNDNGQGVTLPWGLRTVDGTCNNLLPGQEEFGAADTLFPRHVPGRFRGAYAQKKGTVVDTEPRTVSNLVVDQTEANPAAVAAADGATADASGTLPIPNVAPDVGLSAPYNSLFTLFGQFFDHGLDLVTKGGGTVFMPLQPGDPLYEEGSPTNFMILTRATNQPGQDGVVGDDPDTAADESADDEQEHTNTTTAFVDQNQTYTSHASHQAFLREYEMDPGPDGVAGDDPETADVDEGADDVPVDTGRLLGGADGEGLATWGDVKTQAAEKLGVVLTDLDISNVPMLAADPYGNLDVTDEGRPQLVTATGLVPTDPAGTELPDDVTRTGHAFLDDIAHHAVPVGDRNPANGPGPVEPLDADSDEGTSDDGDPTTYDDEMLASHFVAGDGRANENIGLTTVHHVFHSEHNRLVAEIDDMITTLETPENIAAWRSTAGPAGWDYGQRLFQAARFVTEMEYQHLVFEEFARKMQPMVNLFGEGGTGYRATIDPAIRAEFAHAVYRFGHSMLTETVDRTNADGSRNNVSLVEAFLNPQEFTDGGSAGTLTPDQAAGSVVRGMSRQVGNEIDEFVTEALRNNLLGLPLDLATINMARARDAGVPRLNEARRAFYDETSNSALTPYESWADFNYSLRNKESLVNFMAAYGSHTSIQDATSPTDKRTAAQELLDLAAMSVPENPETPEDVALAQDILDAYDFVNGLGDYANENGRTVTGVDDIDLWAGGLAEKPMVFGGMLGATFNYVFETQLEDLQDGDRFYYLSRTAGLNLLTQLEGNSFAELVMRNTDAEGLPADAFSRPDFVFDVARLGTTGAVTDDALTEDWNENQLLTRMPDGTIRFGGGEHVVFNGTAGPNRVWSSEGDDTVRGNDGNDWMQGGDGNDNLIGGLDDDIMLDLAGDDTLKGGDGDDALSSGQGFGGDLNQGGRGKDFVVGGNDMTETFAGPGDDFVFAGDAEDTVFGDDGDDWIEDGKGPFSLLQGDNGAPFQDDPNEPGHDVLNGDGGEQDYDAEGGDDVMMAGPGIQRSEGMLGFDWVTHKEDPVPGNSDMSVTALLPPGIEVNRDRFDLVEALSGWKLDDVLRGDDRAATDIGTDHQLTQAGIDRIDGLAELLPEDATSFDAGNIIVGGTGSDLIEGRGGDDIIDGDAWLNARLSVRTDPADPATEIGSADGMRRPYRAGSTTTLQQAVFNGTVDPGNIVIVREILSTPGADDQDTALFTGPRANYTITRDGPVTSVTDDVGTEGTDTIRRVEALEFADETVDIRPVPSEPVIGTATAGNTNATVTWSDGPDIGAQPTTEHQIEVLRNGEVERTVTGIAGDATSAVVTDLLNDVTYTFRVIAVNPVGPSAPSAESNPVTPDTVFPRVLSSTPADNATDVPVGDNLTATFTRAVSSPNWSSAAQLRNSAGTSVGRVVTYDAATRTVTVNPNANLVQGAAYTLTLVGTGSNGIRDTAGVRLPTTVVRFTTVGDTTSPTVTAVRPADGAVDVPLGRNAIANFSEPVLGLNSANVELRNTATAAVVPSLLSVNAAGTQVTLDPNTNLARNTVYVFTLIGGSSAIRDSSGNVLTTTTVSFRTRP